MEWEYCQQVLPRVSRTFALNIVKLDGDTCKAVTVSYLLLRIADTFEDNLYQNEQKKIEALLHLSSIFKENKGLEQRLTLYELLRFQWEEESAEKELVENGDKVLKCYFTLPPVYRRIIDPLLVESMEGMAKFQERKLRSQARIFQLQDWGELEQYCYYVAGIVGVILTRIFSLREGIAPIKEELEKHQVQFGLALQLTNILKDWQKDLDRGWCYLPRSITSKWGMRLEEISNLAIEQQIEMAKDIIPRLLPYFDAGLRYIELIPKDERPIRLFCIIPFVLAYSTLCTIVKFRGDKISRQEVIEILDRADSYADSNQLLRDDYLRLKEMLK